MSIDSASAGRTLAARLAADPELREAWDRSSRRLLERIPEIQEDYRWFAAAWLELTGSPLPTTNDEWVETAIRFGLSTDRAIDGNFTPRNVVTAMRGMTLRQRDAAGVRGANHADAERKPGGGGRGKNDETITAKLVAEWPAFQEHYCGEGRASRSKYIGHFVNRWPVISARAIERLRKDAAEEQREPEGLHVVLLRWLESGLRSARG